MTLEYSRLSVNINPDSEAALSDVVAAEGVDYVEAARRLIGYGHSAYKAASRPDPDGLHEQDRRRAALLPEVSRLVSSLRWLTAHPELKQTIVAVLPDDTLGYVLDQIRGGVLDEEGRSTFLAVRTLSGIRLFELRDVTADTQPEGDES